MTYAEKLKDPRWQKKRLQVLEKNNFTCQLCGDSETTLHVHHLKYNKEPWDADNSNLQALCKHCHSVSEEIKKIFKNPRIIRCIKQEVDTLEYSINVLCNSRLDNSIHLLIYEYKEENNKAVYVSGVRSEELILISELIIQNKNG